MPQICKAFWKIFIEIKFSVYLHFSGVIMLVLLHLVQYIQAGKSVPSSNSLI